MDATIILIDGDAELLRARALVDQLWNSNDPADVARLEAQARLIAAYEEMKWPRRPPSVGDLIRHLMDQHGLTGADLIPLLGTPSRVSEVMRGKKGLTEDLARGSSVGLTTIRCAELTDSETSMTAANDLAVRRAVEAAASSLSTRVEGDRVCGFANRTSERPNGR